jgi:hypothetical protein
MVMPYNKPSMNTPDYPLQYQGFSFPAHFDMAFELCTGAYTSACVKYGTECAAEGTGKISVPMYDLHIPKVTRVNINHQGFLCASYTKPAVQIVPQFSFLQPPSPPLCYT